MFVYPTATLRIQTWEQGPTITPSAILSLNRGFPWNTASPRCVSPGCRLFLCSPTTPKTGPLHTPHSFHSLAKQTSILRRYSVRDRRREISDHIFRDFFGRTKKWPKSSNGNPRFTNVIPSRSTRRWCGQNNRFVGNIIHLELSFDQYFSGRQTSHQLAFL